ncbi:hypothetical protein L9F63_012936, partial [Diploptera punctata]
CVNQILREKFQVSSCTSLRIWGSVNIPPICARGVQKCTANEAVVTRAGGRRGHVTLFHFA